VPQRRVPDRGIRPGRPLCEGTPVRKTLILGMGMEALPWIMLLLLSLDFSVPSRFFQLLWRTPAAFCREKAFGGILGDVIDEMQEEVA